MTTLLFNNNAVGTTASPITSTATTMQLVLGEGALFPEPGEGQAFYIWAQNGSQVESMLCTNNSGDVLTIQRAQEGTTAQAFAAGTIIEQRVTAAVLNQMLQQGMGAPVGGSSSQVFNVQAGTGANNATTYAQVQALIAALTTAGQLASTGDIKYVTAAAAPQGWLAANGAAVSRATYAALFAVISTTFGTGDGSTTFNLPDLRGVFIRGLDNGRGLDVGRTLGSYQADMFASHTHVNTINFNDPGHSHGVTDPGHTHTQTSTGGYGGGNGTSGTNYDGGSHAVTTSTTGITINTATTGITCTITNVSAGGTETAPKNVALLACIKT